MHHHVTPLIAVMTNRVFNYMSNYVFLVNIIYWVILVFCFGNECSLVITWKSHSTYSIINSEIIQLFNIYSASITSVQNEISYIQFLYTLENIDILKDRCTTALETAKKTTQTYWFERLCSFKIKKVTIRLDLMKERKICLLFTVSYYITIQYFP